MNCAEANQIDLVEYLEKLGYQPQKIRNNDYWYLSPLRQEKEPSFKVNRKLNKWYDHGMGKGGNLVDFGLLYHPCPLHELLKKLENHFYFHPHQPSAQSLENAREKGLIKGEDVREIITPELIAYLDKRKIPLELAKLYCKEVDFEMHGKRYFAIGFKNNAGGYELRNEYFKGSSSPKDATVIQNNSSDIAVFEGFFSFISYQVIHQNNSKPLTNFLVLNSLSFLEKSRDLMEEHQRVNLYLDRDHAGLKATQTALRWSIKYIDKSKMYKNHKDLNDYLVYKSQQIKQGLRAGRHL